jgi:hypothetical protein
MRFTVNLSRAIRFMREALLDAAIMTINSFEIRMPGCSFQTVRIMAIHSHMTQENPRILFLHYWGRGSTTNLANALKTALDTQKK